VLDPSSLYDLQAELAASIADARPALIHLFDGYIDAGSVTHSAARYLLDSCEHQVLATFDHDQLHDYRSRRPQMVFDTNHWTDYTDYSLVLHRLIDTEGKTFLLLSGPEPDTQWNRASAAVLQLAQQLGVSQLLTCSGVPMAVPHTRPTLVTAHSTDPERVSGNPMWIDRVQLPGAFAHVLEYRAGQAGLLAGGFVAHVPHYLAQATFPQATAAVLGRLGGAGGLDLKLDPLHEQAQANLASIEAETAEDAEFPEMIHALEEQYDRLASSGGASMPSAEEIGAAVEQFLAEQDPPNDFRR
jgi:hypothetical protein